MMYSVVMFGLGLGTVLGGLYGTVMCIVGGDFAHIIIPLLTLLAGLLILGVGKGR